MKISMRLGGAMLMAGVFASMAGSQGVKNLKGEIKADGSSTTYLITEAVATNFKKLHGDVNITVGISGTGGGFKKFSAGETDISNASRAIKEGEIKKCKENGINYLELQVAWDGLAVIIHKENTWADKMTVEQLKKIWHPTSESFKHAKKWSDVDQSWPDEKIELYGAGPDSGTFDYFTEAINGKEKVIRNDFHASEDDNNTIIGVERNKNAMGFLGLAYFEAHKDKLKVVAVANKSGDFVLPTTATVLTKKYNPLGRPLFVYIKTASLKRPEVQEFARFYLRRPDLVTSVKYVPMSALQQTKERKKLEEAINASSN